MLSEAENQLLAWAIARQSGVLATQRQGAPPHLVPVVFVPMADAVYIPVDGKPKRSANLARLRNLKREPACSLLIDHYDDDWRRLRWVRVEAEGEVLELSPEDRAVLAARLAAKYPQYDQPSSAGLEPLPPALPQAQGSAAPAVATAIRLVPRRVVGWRADTPF